MRCDATLDAIARRQNKEWGKLILVTAMTATRAGEGKTCTSIGLAQGLAKLGVRQALCLRQPSLGPTFGIKGGAAGGGKLPGFGGTARTREDGAVSSPSPPNPQVAQDLDKKLPSSP